MRLIYFSMTDLLMELQRKARSPLQATRKRARKLLTLKRLMPRLAAKKAKKARRAKRKVRRKGKRRRKFLALCA